MGSTYTKNSINLKVKFNGTPVFNLGTLVPHKCNLGLGNSQRKSHTHKNTNIHVHKHMHAYKPTCLAVSKAKEKTRAIMRPPPLHTSLSSVSGLRTSKVLLYGAAWYPGPTWRRKRLDTSGQWPAPAQAQLLASSPENTAELCGPWQEQARGSGI